MAKASKKAAANFDVSVLNGIADGSVKFVGAAVGKPLLDAGLIVVDNQAVDPNNADQRAVTISDAGKAWLVANAPKPAVPASTFALIDNAVPPPSRRGSGLRSRTGEKKYPFDQLAVNQSFFVAASADIEDPLKSLGSAISAANMRYAEATGETKKAKRAIKGPDGKATKDAAGKLVKEVTDVPVYKFTRRFQIRGVEAGKEYGGWKAPANGALITRVAVE